MVYQYHKCRTEKWSSLSALKVKACIYLHNVFYTQPTAFAEEKKTGTKKKE